MTPVQLRYERAGRFCDLALDGTVLRRVVGGVGARGIASVIAYSSEQAARDDLHRRTLALVGAQWWLAEPAGRPAEAPIELRPASNRALEEAALADLDAIEPLLVWADWLSSAGDPRGELIAIEIAREQGGDDPELHRRRAALIVDPRIVGAVQGGLDWQRGVVPGASVEGIAAPADDELEDLLGAPAAVALHKLRVSRPTRRTWDVLARAPARAARIVELELRASRAVDLAQLWTACPSLKTLDLGGGAEVTLGARSPVALETLRLAGKKPVDLDRFFEQATALVTVEAPPRWDVRPPRRVKVKRR